MVALLFSPQSDYVVLPGTADIYMAQDGVGAALSLANTTTAHGIGAFTTGVWNEAAKTITLANQFTNYATGLNNGAGLGVSTTYPAFAGDKILITAGTGVVPGSYPIVNAISGGTSTGDVLTLQHSITGGAGGAPTDVTGSASVASLHQTRNFLWIGNQFTAPTNGRAYDMILHEIIPITAPAATDGVSIVNCVAAGTTLGKLDLTAKVANSLAPLIDARGYPLTVSASAASQPIGFKVVGTASWMVLFQRFSRS